MTRVGNQQRSPAARLAALGLALLLGLLPAAPGPTTPVAAAAGPVSDRLGIDRISYGNGTFSAERYRLAQSTGAGWNRWVFYWNEIERIQGIPDYSRQDRTVAADAAANFKILGILLGTPEWASGGGTGARPAALPPPQVDQRRYPVALEEQAARLANASPITAPPQGLERPVFADGTDTPAPGKTINPTNPWARFVHQTVTRYKGRVQTWEVWNEPDFTPTAATGWFWFWTGTVDQYARLLKVAYLAAKSAGPNTTVVMGGMAFWHQPDFFPRLLRAIRLDPTARVNGYYFGATAWHWYSRASQLYERTLWIKDELARAGATRKPVWVTEANIPVCGDPALKEKLTCTAGNHRGTIEHQAAFITQALAHAWVAGVDKVFIFQLYDDDLGPGEYYGLVRNDGTARPALTALRVAAGYLAGGVAVYRTLNNNGRVEMVTVLNDRQERVRLVWGTGRDPVAIDLPVEGSRPARGDQYGSVQPLGVPPGAVYRMGIPPATLDDGPRGYSDYIVGGPVTAITEGAITTTGVPVRVGDRRVTSAAAGEFQVDVMPGQYDVAVAEESPFPSRTGPSLSVAVWSGRAVDHALSVQPQRRLTLPFVVRGAPQPGR